MPRRRRTSAVMYSSQTLLVSHVITRRILSPPPMANEGLLQQGYLLLISFSSIDAAVDVNNMLMSLEVDIKMLLLGPKAVKEPHGRK